MQSNHARQVAAAAARLGPKALLVRERWNWPDVLYDRGGNIQLSRIMGADVRLAGARFGISVKTSWEQALDEVRARRCPRTPPRWGPRTSGWAVWALQTGQTRVPEQERQLGPSSTRSLLGDRLDPGRHDRWVRGQDRPRRVIGIDASDKLKETSAQSRRSPVTPANSSGWAVNKVPGCGQV